MSVGQGRLSDRELLARLIAFPSVSDRSNRDIADFLADYLEQAGCRVWRQTYAEGTRHNVVAHVGPLSQASAAGETSAGNARPRPGLTLSGHMDVVPAVEPDWQSDPFELDERGGQVFGRGVADMKGFVALAVNLVAERATGGLGHPLAIALSADEETGCIGAQYLSQHLPPEPLPAGALVGEPTDLRVVRMHKGHLRMYVRLRGRPAHSAYPHLGDSAIEKAIPVLDALKQLSLRWREKRAATSRFFPECPYPVLNVGTIHGGAAVNIVPENCEIQFGIRLLPGQQSPEAVNEVRSAIEQATDGPRPEIEIGVENDSPPMFCREEAPVHQLLRALAAGGDDVGASYATDGGALSLAGLDCVLFGAGRIEDAHRANERLDISQWQRSRSVLEQAIQAACERG